MTSAAAFARSLTQDQRTVILGLNMNRCVRRPGIAGRDYFLSPTVTGTREGRLRFDETLVARMVSDGLLYVTQTTGALPGRPEGVPFSARLSKLGCEVRTCLVDNLTGSKGAVA